MHSETMSYQHFSIICQIYLIASFASWKSFPCTLACSRIIQIWYGIDRSIGENNKACSVRMQFRRSGGSFLYLSALFSDGLKGACSHLNNLFFPQGKNICEYVHFTFHAVNLFGWTAGTQYYMLCECLNFLYGLKCVKKGIFRPCVLYVSMSVVHMRYVVNSFSTYLFMLY